MAATGRELDAGPIVLYDGVCNLCDAAVRFIVDRDPHGRVRFASLQSELGRDLLAAFDTGQEGSHRGSATLGSEAGDPGTMYLIEDGRLYDRSTAALRICRHLNGIWPVFGVYQVVPVALRDAVYDLVARQRSRWFGRREDCRLPTAEEAGRFLG